MRRSAAEVLASLAAPRVVVVGDLLLDRYVTGAVMRISPEAPIPVLRVERDETRLGGAGSVANNLAVLGAKVVLVGVLGDDEAVRVARDRAAAAGIRLAAPAAAGRPTSLKTRHLARSHSIPQQVLRVDSEVTEPISGALEREVLAALEAELAGADAAFVSDYAKGCLTDAILARLFAWGRETSRPVVVDPKGEEFARYRGATCVTPNREEARLATGIRIASLADAERAADRLLADLDLRFALITLDRDGMFLKDRSGAAEHFPTTPREVFDVTGAGDMVLSVLGLVLAGGGTPAEAADLANVAAGLEVERVGVVPITREEIAARLNGSRGPRPGTKIVPRAEAAALAARLRATGRRVVFTNGCFDVLHAGHVRYLRSARALGDVLIVGLNSDAGVRRLKGEGRPVNPFADRAEVLAALEAVDHVVEFAEDVPTRLIEEVIPDFLVKGEDWRDKGVEGREFVEEHGGKVILTPLVEGRSTTSMIERIRNLPGQRGT